MSKAETKSFILSKWQFMRAFELVKANKGAAGVDGESIAVFEKDLKGNLYKLWNRMSSGSYFPPAVKAVSIPKKSGGERLLGVPTVSDRIAQMVVKLELEPVVEPHFLPDSYGYRPNKSALDAVSITRQRCWKYDWVLEFDIKGLFDNISHELIMKAVEKHTQDSWVLLYIRRWLTANMQLQNKTIVKRSSGTPQGGVASPLLANLFLHYVFDKWLQKYYPQLEWCRYADDGLIHCRTYQEAEKMLEVLKQRFNACGLEMHPQKTKIVYCKDGKRTRNYENTSFDFLGYTFRTRGCKSREGKMFTNFTPAISRTALKLMSEKLRNLELFNRTELSLETIAKRLNPMIQGWLNYYGRFTRSALYATWRLINNGLIRWARKKYKPLRKRSRRAASNFMVKVAKHYPKLFAHWRAGMMGAFV